VNLVNRHIVSILTAASTVGIIVSGVAFASPTNASTAAGRPSSVATTHRWQPEPATYGVAVEQNVPIHMSDGTTLLADIYRPADPATGQPALGRFPVILAQTPYRKSGVLTITGGDGYYPYLVQRGYINVVVDVRGTGSSGGTWQFFGPREVQDGVELVRWCAKLPGSTGKVGLAGASYLGINQLLVAAAVGPNSPLKAIFPVIAGNDLYRDTSFMGGIPDTEFSLPWLALRAGLDVQPADNTTSDPVTAAETELEHASWITAFDVPFMTNVETGGDKAYDDTWWQLRNPANALARIVYSGIPAFMVGGWFDLFQRGEMMNYAGLQNAWAGRPVYAPMTPVQPVTGRYQLVMGPWYHLTATASQQIQEWQLEWFDTWLKGEPTGMADTHTPLHVYTLAQGRWVDTDRYPFSSAHVTTYYLAGGRTGTAPSLNDGFLSPTKPVVQTGSDSIAWTGATSPLSRQTEQWSMGATTFAGQQAGLPPVPYTQDDRAFEASGLTYTTQPFTTGKVLAGPIDVTLYASANTSDTEWVVTVEDVRPDGAAYPLTQGALLGSQRALDTSRSWTVDGRLILPYHPYTAGGRQSVTPGQVTRYDIEVFPTFAYIAPGHRLRVTITTSDTPHLMPTPAQLPNLIGGVYHIQRTAAFPSCVNVPLADPGAFKTSPVVWGPSGS
jgi:putative CocE/NonD family hydrolase